MEGEVRAAVVRAGAGWRVEMELQGGYSTPWPDKEPLSGAEWTSPEGEPVMVPYIDTAATLTGVHSLPLSHLRHY